MSALTVGRFVARIEPEARAAICAAAALSDDGRETGGILLGRDPDRVGQIKVQRAAGPGPNAVRTPTFFLRDLGYSRRLARLAYEREGLQWVGDWHTHPRGPAEPSSFDLGTYSSHLEDPDLGFEVFVAVIVTPHADRGWSRCQLGAFPLSLLGRPARRL